VVFRQVDNAESLFPDTLTHLKLCHNVLFIYHHLVHSM